MKKKGMRWGIDEMEIDKKDDVPGEEILADGDLIRVGGRHRYRMGYRVGVC